MKTILIIYFISLAYFKLQYNNFCTFEYFYVSLSIQRPCGDAWQNFIWIVTFLTSVWIMVFFKTAAMFFKIEDVKMFGYKHNQLIFVKKGGYILSVLKEKPTDEKSAVCSIEFELNQNLMDFFLQNLNWTWIPSKKNLLHYIFFNSTQISRLTIRMSYWRHRKVLSNTFI